MAVPGRLRAEGRDRKIMWRGSQGAASAERHVILPDLQSEPIVFHKKLGEGGLSTATDAPSDRSRTTRPT